MAEEERLSLVNLMGGLAIARFDDELQKVLNNIVDPNTPAKAKREVTLKTTWLPDSDRDLSRMEISVTSKLAAAEKVATKVFIALTRQGPVATEHNPSQPCLQFDEPTNVAPLRPVGEKP